MSVSVLIVDDHEVVRQGLARMLAAANLRLVAAAGDAQQAVEMARQHRPDVVLMDVQMPDMDGLTAIVRVRAAHPAARFVSLSSHDNPTYIARAVAVGASDYLLKEQGQQAIVAALRRAAADQPAPADSILARTRAAMHPTEAFSAPGQNLPLTAREWQVLRHVALALSNKEIASSLQISVETVKEHVQNILRKLGASDRTDAAVRALRLGLV